MQDLRQVALRRRHPRQPGNLLRRRNRLDQPLRQLPARQQRRAQLIVIESQRVLLERRQMTLLLDDASQEFCIRLAQLAEQHQNSNVLQQTGNERLIARLSPHLLGNQPRRHRPRQCICPIPFQLARGDFGKQRIGHTEAQHQQLQRLDANQPNRLIEIRDRPMQPIERAIDHSQHLARECRILSDAFLQRAASTLG